MSTILIVDDAPVIQRLLSLTLRRVGHTVVTVSDGYEALELMGDMAIDLAIVDLAMPDMDGLTLLHMIRTDATYSSLPVIMLTASGQDHDRLRAREAGANDFLTKPTSSRELIATISRLMN